MIEFKTQTIPPGTKIFTYERRNDVLANIRTYDSTIAQKKTILLADSIAEIKQFLENIKFPNTTKMQLISTDKVFVHASSDIPALLINRLGLSIKRITDNTKADKIICSKSFIPEFKFDKHNIDIQGIKNNQFHCVSSWCLFYDSENDLTLRKIQLENILVNGTVKFVYNLSSDQHEWLKFIATNDVNKIIFDNTFISTILPQLTPFSSEEEFQSIISNLISKDQGSQTIAFNALPYYDIRDKIPEIYFALCRSDNVLINTVNSKYLYKILETSPRKIEAIRGCNPHQKLQRMFCVLDNPYIMSSARDTVYKLLRNELLESIQDNYQTEAKALNVSIKLEINDQNGASESSN